MSFKQTLLFSRTKDKKRDKLRGEQKMKERKRGLCHILLESTLDVDRERELSDR